MTGGKTSYDDKIHADDEPVPIVLGEPDCEPEPEFNGSLFSNAHPHGPIHLSTHLPKSTGCEGCGLAKAAKSPSRRKLRFTNVRPEPDAEGDFGALVHGDHIEMERGSDAARAARFCLNLHDERTLFFRPFPVHAKDTNSVVDALHKFDTVSHVCGGSGPTALQNFELLRAAFASSGLLHITALPPTGPRPTGGRSASIGSRSRAPGHCLWPRVYQIIGGHWPSNNGPRATTGRWPAGMGSRLGRGDSTNGLLSLYILSARSCCSMCQDHR